MGFTKIIVLLLFSSSLARAGCGEASFGTSIGISYPYIFGSGGTFFSRDPDSLFTMTAYGYSPCSNMVSEVRVFLDCKIIYEKAEPSSARRITLPQLPGTYKVAALFKGSPCSWTFVIYPRLQVGVIETTSLETDVGIIALPNPDFIMQPNPAREQITLSNETDFLRTVSVFSLDGKLHSKTELNAATVTISLNDFKPGIYVVQVATISDKIIIKKFAVL